MWSLFSRDPAKDFAFEIKDEVESYSDKSIWKLYTGKRKANGEDVSIFVFDIKGTNDTELQLAKSSFKRMKTLRHPNLLSYVDGLETDKVLYVVTESVIPLATHIEQQTNQNSIQNHMAISWSIHQITKGLSFIISDCGLMHNNVCLSSMFVDKGGEWKLGGFEYMYPTTGQDSYPPVKIIPDLNKYDPPEKTSGQRSKKPTEIWSLDMWGLGCLIWEIFNGNLPKTASLKTLGKIPKNLVAHYCALVGANPKSRPSPVEFLKQCQAKGGFMDNKFIKANIFLEEIQIKDDAEKSNFFNSLPPLLDSFPVPFCKHKILPQLINAFEFGNAGSAVLTPLFKIGKYLDTDEYQRLIVPCVVKLFSSTDRATRVKLFQQIEHFVQHLQADVVNDKIFPSIVSGFLDSHPLVREHTIKSILHLASKLNYKNLNEEVLKHFARLQSRDDQGGIRTNTTVCLGKIACHLHPQIRQKVLSSAYLRALKDPFPPSRQAGILAMAATHHYFTLQESAVKLIPALSLVTMDTDKQVRDHAFRAIKCFIGKLEKVSENPELLADMEKDVSSGSTSSSSSSSWAGWAVTGMGSLTSRLVKGKGQGGSKVTSSGTATASSQHRKSPPTQSQPVAPSNSPEEEKHPSQERHGAEEKSNTAPQVSDGWDEDDWEDDKAGEDGGMNEGGAEGGGWEDSGWDEDWAGIEEEKTEDCTSSVVQDDLSPWGNTDFTPVEEQNTTSTYDWGEDNNDDFFSSMLDKKPAKKAAKITCKPTNDVKPTPSSKQPISSAASLKAANQSTDGWDDDWGDKQKQQDEDKAAELKRKREERRIQRQKELQERRAAKSRAMKLGATKLNKM